MRNTPLSTRLADHAESLLALAHDVSGREPSLGSHLAVIAAETALLHCAAQDLERGLPPLAPLHPIGTVLADRLRQSATHAIGAPA